MFFRLTIVAVLILTQGSLLTLLSAGYSPDNVPQTQGVQQPKYPGGEEALFAFLEENIKYPQSAIDNNVEGTVWIRFEVRKNGKIRDAEILRGIGSGCDEEALRVVQLMPTWIPGKDEEGNVTAMLFMLPIKFTLK